jgi:hypothetical protein
VSAMTLALRCGDGETVNVKSKEQEFEVCVMRASEVPSYLKLKGREGAGL